MFCDVVQCFLNDSVKSGFDLGGDAQGLVLIRLEIHLYAAARRPGLDQAANRFHKSELIERRWT
jgi:hypothetical protein